MRHGRRLTTALSALLLVSLVCAPGAFAQRRFSDGAMPPPRFADPERARKLAAAFPEIEKLFTAWVERRRMPGAVMGVVVEGELDRKRTRLNSSYANISYAVFCLKKKNSSILLN